MTVPCLGIKRECGAGNPNAAAAPATVSGESFVMCHWESRSRAGGDKVSTRGPGDLPSAVVTREGAGRGVHTSASQGCCKAHRTNLVRSCMPLTSYRGYNHVL